MINLGIIKFKKNYQVFSKLPKNFVGVDQIGYKNVKGSSQTQANQILFSRNLPKKSALFFLTQFQMQSNHYEMKLPLQNTLFFLDIDSTVIHCFSFL